MIARAKGLPAGAIKCMALVESHPLAYQMEEFAWNLREHILGLNLGRWDYMASLIHFNLENPEWVLPDRNTIPHNVAFFQNLRELMPEICHKHGMLAIGGMTALFPSREDARTECAGFESARGRQEERIDVVDGWRVDRPSGSERDCGCAIPCSQSARARVRQTTTRIRICGRLPTGVGKRTLAGTRAAIRTVIRYRNGVLNGKGASLLDGYMEDLATDRIYRLMIAQRLKHSSSVEILDESGAPVRHTPELISRLFDEELERLLGEPANANDPKAAASLREARNLSEEMIRRHEFNPA